MFSIMYVIRWLMAGGVGGLFLVFVAVMNAITEVFVGSLYADMFE